MVICEPFCKRILLNLNMPNWERRATQHLEYLQKLMSLNKTIRFKLRSEKEQSRAYHQTWPNFEYLMVMFYVLKRALSANQSKGDAGEILVNGVACTDVYTRLLTFGLNV